VGLSFLAGIPASFALARYSFRFKEQLAFLFLSFRFARSSLSSFPFIFSFSS